MQRLGVADAQPLGAFSRDGINLGAVDVPRLALDDAGIDLAVFHRLVGGAGALLFHGHRGTHLAVHLKRVSGYCRARRQRQGELALCHPIIIVAEIQLDHRLRDIAEDAHADVRFLDGQDFQRAIRLPHRQAWRLGMGGADGREEEEGFHDSGRDGRFDDIRADEQQDAARDGGRRGLVFRVDDGGELEFPALQGERGVRRPLFENRHA